MIDDDSSASVLSSLLTPDQVEGLKAACASIPGANLRDLGLLYTSLDHDGDGKVDASELMETMKSKYGNISAELCLATHGAFNKSSALLREAQAAYNELDSDGDGKVSPQEFMNAARSKLSGLKDKKQLQALFQASSTRAKAAYDTAMGVYAALDANGDGRVDVEEFKQALKAQVKNMSPEQIKAQSQKLLTTARTTFANHVNKAKEMYQSLDTDGDGKVSTEEFKQAIETQLSGLPSVFRRKLTDMKQLFSASQRLKVIDGLTNDEKVVEVCMRIANSGYDLQTVFTKYDKNRDGTLDLVEFTDAIIGMRLYSLDPAGIMDTFNAFDADHNGSISYSEFSSCVDEVVARPQPAASPRARISSFVVLLLVLTMWISWINMQIQETSVARAFELFFAQLLFVVFFGPSLWKLWQARMSRHSFWLDLENDFMTQKSQAVFEEFDVDDSGFLEADECPDAINSMYCYVLKYLPTEAPLKLSLDKLQRMKKIGDVNKDGKLSLEEFQLMFKLSMMEAYDRAILEADKKVTA